MTNNRRRVNKKPKKGGSTSVAPPPLQASIDSYTADIPRLLHSSGNQPRTESSPSLLREAATTSLDSKSDITDICSEEVLRSVEVVDELLASFQASDPPIEELCKDLAPRTVEGTNSEQGSEPAPTRLESNDFLQIIDRKLNELVEKSVELERERLDIQELRKQLQHAIESAELRMSMRGTDSANTYTHNADNTAATLRTENERLVALLNHTKAEYQTLLEFIEKDEVRDLTNSVRNENLERELELKQEIDRLQEKNKLLQDELGSSLGTGAEGELKRQLASLRNDLMESRHEVVDLRLKCNELTSRLTQYQDPKTVTKDAFSWEDRKQAWLHQLEREETDGSIEESKSIEVREIIERTSEQIQLRNQEIADLKSLLEQQAVATNGIAVGAAAIAQLVDADELIAEERLRLKELQTQWEQKQRQGEIEMSLERAKLARERLELQEKLRSLEAAQEKVQASSPSPSSDSTKPQGRWWVRLGLKDD